MTSVACHVHSDWSYDGSWSLQNLASLFQSRRTRVVLMTEHDRGFTPERFAAYREACAAASSNQILIVPGIEYSDPTNTIHILVWGTPFLGADLPTDTLLRAVTAANGIAVLAHPSRKHAWTQIKPEWLYHLRGIEVWNRKTDGWAPSEPAQRLLTNSKLVKFVGLDFHNRRQLFPLALHLTIVGELSETSVVECLRTNDVHASAFGRSLQSALSTVPKRTLAVAEFCRRNVASRIRALKSKANSQV